MIKKYPICKIVLFQICTLYQICTIFKKSSKSAYLLSQSLHILILIGLKKDMTPIELGTLSHIFFPDYDIV